jgi:hypothetical protein
METAMTTGLDVLDTTVQETNLWLKDVMERIGTYDRHSAYSTFACGARPYRPGKCCASWGAAADAHSRALL